MGPDDLVGHITGDVESEGGVLVVKRIHARYEVKRVDEAKRDTVERVRAMHADKCPVARSIKGSIEVTTEVTYL